MDTIFPLHSLMKKLKRAGTYCSLLCLAYFLLDLKLIKRKNVPVNCAAPLTFLNKCQQAKHDNIPQELTEYQQEQPAPAELDPACPQQVIEQM